MNIFYKIDYGVQRFGKLSHCGCPATGEGKVLYHLTLSGCKEK